MTIDSEALLRLMVGLIGGLYLLLASRALSGGRPPQTMMPIVAVAAAVVGMWVFAPGFMAAGMLFIPILVRQASLFLGGVAVAAQYVAVRRAAHGDPTPVIGAISAPLLGTCFAVASANWLVGTAAAVIVSTTLLRRVGGSRDEDAPQTPLPPDNE